MDETDEVIGQFSSKSAQCIERISYAPAHDTALSPQGPAP